MRTSRFTMRRHALALLVVVGMLLFPASSAFADPGGVVTFTNNVRNKTNTFVDVNPCTGDPASITNTFNQVLHTTLFVSGPNAGTFHVTGTATGDFVLDTIDPTKPDFTGHVASWFGVNSNRSSEAATATFNFHGVGSDGSRLRGHLLAHVNVTPSGATLSFFKMNCG